MYTQKAFRDKAYTLRNLAVLAAVATLISAGCNSQQSAATPGASGTQQALNNPNAPNDLQQQAAHQQQLGQQQAQAMEQAHEHEIASGKAK